MPTMKKAVPRVLILLLLLSGCAALKHRAPAAEDWQMLFNGVDLEGWTVKIHHHETGVNFGNTFRVEDGILQVRYDAYGDFNEQFGHLYYDQPFSHYRLRLAYRFIGEMEPTAPSYVNRNSGIMIHSQDPRNMLKEQNWPISVEMQFLGGLEPGVSRPTGNMCSPGTHIVFNGELDTRHCINSTSDTYYGDQWVEAEIEVYGDSLVIHKIEGEEVLRYSQPQIGGPTVVGHDPAAFEEGKLLREGFIALQAEGQPLDFRNIELLNLAGCTDPEAINFKPWFVHPVPEACIYK